MGPCSSSPVWLATASRKFPGSMASIYWTVESSWQAWWYAAALRQGTADGGVFAGKAKALPNRHQMLGGGGGGGGGG